MPVTINGDGSITGLSVGGLGSGVVNTATLADGAASGSKLGTGSVIQVVQTYKTDTFNDSITYNDETGDITGLTASITPSNASNKILIMFDVPTGNSASSRIGIKIYKAGSVLTGSLGAASGSHSRVTSYCSTMQNDRSWAVSGKYLDTAGGTSSITYSLRLRIGNQASNTVYVNRQATLYDSPGSMVAGASLILMEIAG